MRKIFVLALMALMFAGCSGDDVITTGTIVGSVTDDVTGEPIYNVTLTLSPTGISATTGADGMFEFVDMAASQYKMQARHANYKTDTKTVVVVGGEIVRGDMRLVPKE